MSPGARLHHVVGSFGLSRRRPRAVPLGRPWRHASVTRFAPSTLPSGSDPALGSDRSHGLSSAVSPSPSPAPPPPRAALGARRWPPATRRPIPPRVPDGPAAPSSRRPTAPRKSRTPRSPRPARPRDRPPDPPVGTATTVIAVHSGHDFILSGVGVRLQKGRGPHNLSARAPPTLRRLLVQECLLHRVQRSLTGQSLNRADGSTVDGG